MNEDVEPVLCVFKVARNALLLLASACVRRHWQLYWQADRLGGKDGLARRNAITSSTKLNSSSTA
jgi:hypothetical protein